MLNYILNLMKTLEKDMKFLKLIIFVCFVFFIFAFYLQNHTRTCLCRLFFTLPMLGTRLGPPKIRNTLSCKHITTTQTRKPVKHLIILWILSESNKRCSTALGFEKQFKTFKLTMKHSYLKICMFTIFLAM